MNLTLDDMRKILDVYDKVPTAPTGYELTGEFRKPTDDDCWLPDDLYKPLLGSWPYPRLILRKLPETELTCTVSTKDVYPTGYKIPEGYESLGFGLKHQEATHYLSTESTGHVYPIGWKGFAEARILLKKKA